MNAERLSAAETDLLLVMNAWDYQAANRYRLSKRIEKIPGMGVDFSRLASTTKADGLRLRAQLGIPENDFVLLYPAEFSKRKSQYVLIEAMKKMPPNVWLVLCGEGEQLPVCRALAKQLNVDSRILFPGYVTNIGAWYQMADALTASSRSEGLPFNVMEAMYMGVPVIASAVKGHTDLICDGETGILVPYGDAAAYAAKVKDLAGNTQARLKIGRAAKAASKQYELSNVLPRVMERYLNAAERER